MSYIKVNIISPNGQTFTAEIDENIAIEVLLNDLIDKLNLPQKAQNGTPLEYSISLLNDLKLREGAIIKINKNESTDRFFSLTNSSSLKHFSTPDKSSLLSSLNKIFIIHGHDEELKREVQLQISRAGLDDVVLHERPDKGRTIIDKLIEEAKNAAYVIGLMSPDDEFLDGTKRARQNVILEIGYFLGKLGKERIRILKKGNVEIPSDLQGILYTEVDKDGAWKMKILKEMKAVGVNILLEKFIEKY